MILIKGTRKLLYLGTLISLCLLTVFNVGITDAISDSAITSIRNNTVFFDPTEVPCGSQGSSTGGSTAIQGPAAWNSGLQPPYYLEEFVINVLEDIAKVSGTPQTSTVTQEHVVALVAWAWEEGGNIANTDIFNPWNTGLDDPSLLAGGGSSNGVQSFKSFDAGVTAATITMTGSNQNRLEQVLTDPNSTAEQFVNALTYYQKYKGNQAWARADVQDQQLYLQTLTTVLGQTRSDYDNRASTEIGPGQEDTNHVPKGELKYGGGSSNPTSDTGQPGGSDSCSTDLTSSVGCSVNGVVADSSNAEIACQVLKYTTLSYSEAWHSSGSVFHANCDATYRQSNQKPAAEINGHAVGPLCATDCSGLVGIALYDLFNNDGSWTTYTMVADADQHLGNFKIIPFSETEPGDFVQPNPGHVEIIEQVNHKVNHSSGMMQTFAAHTNSVPQPQQVGENRPYPNAPGFVYLRYTGKGANAGGALL